MKESLPSLAQTITGYKKLFASLQTFFFSLREKNCLDITITVIFAVIWLFFAWQYGFYNSPDSWYRGVLGRSIVEGQPYFINLKQGWLYEYGPWHHDATHEPLLPLIYAFFFLLFGNKIIIANLVSVISAALTLFFLLRLSRKLTGRAWLAAVIYPLVVFNKEAAYLFEVTAGLSIPTLLLTIIAALYFLWRTLESEKRIYIWGAVLSLASFYYVRSDAQLIFYWLLIWSFILARRFLSRAAVKRLNWVWLGSFLLTFPWSLRKLIIFQQPFFSHITPMLWTDRGYDYWSYHEAIPLPTPGSYFQSHSFYDFFNKILIAGPGNFYSVFQRVVTGPLWLYLLIFIFAAVYLYRRTAEKRQRFILLLAWLIFVGYFGVYSLVPVLEVRYIIPVYFILFFTVLIAAARAFAGNIKAKPALQLGLLVVLLVWLVGIFPKDFLKFSPRFSDRENSADVLVNALKQKISKNEIILGPFADVQRLSFATGLTFIEEPDNLKALMDPPAFFRKYNIRYSLIDVTHLLPEWMIEDIGMIGDRALFTITYEAGAVRRPAVKSLLETAEIKKAVIKGLKNRLVFIDARHGADPGDLTTFHDFGLKPYISHDDLVTEKERLFKCGLFIMRYGLQRSELTEAEHLVIQQYIANGGRVLLMAPAWVYVTYERKGLETFSYNRIAKNFGLMLSGEYAERPFRVADKDFRVPGLEEEIDATSAAYSTVVYNNRGRPVLVGKDGRAVAVAAESGRAKIFIWSQNNLLGEVSLKPRGREFTRRIFTWLMK